MNSAAAIFDDVKIVLRVHSDTMSLIELARQVSDLSQARQEGSSLAPLVECREKVNCSRYRLDPVRANILAMHVNVPEYKESTSSPLSSGCDGRTVVAVKSGYLVRPWQRGCTKQPN